MKKLLLGAMISFGLFTTATAQKNGYINANELMGTMPEAEKAQKAMQDFQLDLQQTYQDLTVEFNRLDSVFSVDSVKLSPTMKEIKRKELGTKYMEIQNFQQSSQEKMQAKQEELLGPIQNKALETIKTVAKENGYSYIFKEESLLVAPPGDNILQLCKTKLGIKAPAPAKPAAGAIKK
jgi:outer membrane protein